MAQRKYIGRIKNITINEWVSDETQGNATHNRFKKYACIFNDEADAIATLELLNDVNADCFVLIDNE